MTRVFSVVWIPALASGFGFTFECDPGPLVFAIEPDFPGWSECTPDASPDGKTTWTGECEGVVEPLYKQVCKAASLECSHVVTEWHNVWDNDAGAGAGWAAGDFDVAAAGRSTGPRRAACMHFSDPYTTPDEGYLYATAATVATPPGPGAEVTMCAIRGWSIGAEYLETLRSADANGWTITVDDSLLGTGELEAAVDGGACDFGLFGAVHAKTLSLYETIPAEKHGVGGVGYMTNGASAKSACILKRLNHGLDLIQASGELVTTLTADPEFKAKPELSLTHPNAAC